MSKHFKSTSERNLKKSFITKTPSVSNLQIKDPSSIISIHIKCITDKVARQYCSTPTCTAKSLFVCLDDECLCHIEHETCQLTSIAPTLRKIKSKISDPSINLKQEINKKFDSLINSINQCRQSLLTQVENQKDNLRLNGLSQIEKIFMKIAQKNQGVELFSASQSYQLWKTINSKSHQNKNILEQFKSKLNNFQLQQKETFKKFTQHAFDFTHSQAIKESDLDTTDLKSSKSIHLHYPSYVFGQSEIIQSLQMSQRMTKMLERQTVKNARLLYRASLNGFNVKEYLKKYGSQNNTLVICRTEHDKIVGGFSPLSHQFTGKGRKDFLGNQPVADATKSSFIFSLSNNQKFDLIKSSFAVYRYKTKNFLQFGQGELRISQKLNEQKTCEALINNGAYYNASYKDDMDNKSKNIRFNGGQSAMFSLKQWQVWKIITE